MGDTPTGWRVCQTCSKRKQLIRYVDGSPNCKACLSQGARVCATCNRSKAGRQYKTHLSIDCRGCEQRARGNDPEYCARQSELARQRAARQQTDPEFRARYLAGYQRWLNANPEYRDRIWSHAEDEIIRALHGKEPVAEIARRCSELSGVRRTPGATKNRAHKIGHLVWRDCPSVADAARICGVEYTTIRKWMRQGLLRGRAWGDRLHVFDDSELRAFIENYPWQVNPARMQRGPLKALAEVLHRKRPWFTTTEACHMLGCGPVTVRKWARSGQVPYQLRVGPHGGAYMFDAEGIEALTQLLAQRDPRQVEYGRLGAIARARQLRELKVAA